MEGEALGVGVMEFTEFSEFLRFFDRKMNGRYFEFKIYSGVFNDE